MDIYIRTAQECDFPTLLVLLQYMLDYHNAFARGDFPEKIGFFQEDPCQSMQILSVNPNARLLVAETEGIVAGLLFAKIERPPFYLPVQIEKIGIILEWFVQEPYRKKGLGKQLFAKAREWFQENGINRIEVEVDARNKDGTGVYKGLGFVPYRIRMKLIEG